MSEELKKKVSKSKFDSIELITDQPYKHHKEGDFTCESEVKADGKLTCCLHNPITGEWKWVEK